MNIFFNSLGEFQWASVAAIIAGVGAIVSLIFSILGYKNSKKTLKQQEIMDQKKIDADIISKSRMHWIDNTRALMTKFVSNALDLSAQNVMFNQKIIQYNNQVLEASALKIIINDPKETRNKKKEAKEAYDYWNDVGSEYFNKEMLERVDTMNNLIKIIYKDFLLIKLNFSDNEENNKVVDLCYEINEELRIFSLSNGWNQYSTKQELDKAVDKAIKIRESNAKKVEQLVECLRDYYKTEWEKVKEGK